MLHRGRRVLRAPLRADGGPPGDLRVDPAVHDGAASRGHAQLPDRLVRDRRGARLGALLGRGTRWTTPATAALHREYNWTMLHYAGNGQFSYEEDMYNPTEFGDDDQGLARRPRRRPRASDARRRASAVGRHSNREGIHPWSSGSSTASTRRASAYEDVDDQWAVEAQRLQNEINWTIAADKAGFKYTWATEHHFLTEYSHLSSNEAFLGYLAGRDRAHPPRQRHLQHHAAGRAPGARRREGRDARPPLGRSLRVRHRARLVDAPSSAGSASPTPRTPSR